MTQRESVPDQSVVVCGHPFHGMETTRQEGQPYFGACPACPAAGPARRSRVQRAAERIFQSGLLDDIYEHAFEHGRRGGLDSERDAMEDAVQLASLAFDEQRQSNG